MRAFLKISMFTGFIAVSNIAAAQSMLLSFSNQTFETNNIFSDIQTFEFAIDIDAPLAAGRFENPPLNSVTYSVFGALVEGTPSGFPSFNLEREITGEEFYAQGSSLVFEIADTAVLDDGVQIAELIGTDVVFQFDGREVDNGRFHPALVQLSADGTGRLQNSNNVPTMDPLLEVPFGAEYIVDLLFDAGNTTLIIDPDPQPTTGGTDTGAGDTDTDAGGADTGTGDTDTDAGVEDTSDTNSEGDESDSSGGGGSIAPPLSLFLLMLVFLRLFISIRPTR